MSEVRTPFGVALDPELPARASRFRREPHVPSLEWSAEPSPSLRTQAAFVPVMRELPIPSYLHARLCDLIGPPGRHFDGAEYSALAIHCLELGLHAHAATLQARPEPEPIAD